MVVSEMTRSNTNANSNSLLLWSELREISDKHSSNRNCQSVKTNNDGTCWVDPSSREEESSANVFLLQTKENPMLNQYWYSKNTIETLCNAIQEGLATSNGIRIAFLSTPSLFFSLPPEERRNSVIFDYDTSWNSCPEYHFYDYNDPTNVKDSMIGTFDLVVADPPFISQSVWENYATTARLLWKKKPHNIIATTVKENADLMSSLFGCKPAMFQPSIPHLVYQYSVFTNFPSMALAKKNPELRE